MPAFPDGAKSIKKFARIVGLHGCGLTAQMIQKIFSDILILPPRAGPRFIRHSLKEQSRIFNCASSEDECFAVNRVAIPGHVHYAHPGDAFARAFETDYRISRQDRKHLTGFILFREHDGEAGNLEPACEKYFEFVANLWSFRRHAFPDRVIVMRLALQTKIFVGFAVEWRYFVIFHRPGTSRQPIAAIEVNWLKFHKLSAPEIRRPPQASAPRDADPIVRRANGAVGFRGEATEVRSSGFDHEHTLPALRQFAGCIQSNRA